jgi:hypothetical protein
MSSASGEINVFPPLTALAASLPEVEDGELFDEEDVPVPDVPPALIAAEEALVAACLHPQQRTVVAKAVQNRMRIDVCLMCLFAFLLLPKGVLVLNLRRPQSAMQITKPLRRFQTSS